MSDDRQRTRRGKEAERAFLQLAKSDGLDDASILTAHDQLAVNPEDRICADLIEGAAHAALLREALNNRPFERANREAASIARGPIKLGKIEHTEYVYGISARDLRANVLICGGSGAGKSCLSRAIISGLMGNKSETSANVTVHDSKSEYFDLSDNPAVDFLWLKLAHFHDNWLRPAGATPARAWANVLGELLSTHLELRGSGTALLTECIYEILAEYEARQ